MAVHYIIKFSPEAKIDYKFNLVIVTEREKFIVPIVAIGKRSMIDFPDLIDFGHCPVKYKTEKPIIIRNLGEKTTKWHLKLPEGFEANKEEGVLEQQKNEQIIIKFYPQESCPYHSEAMLGYDGLYAHVALKGTAYTGNVYLSK
jgi:hydrocephalus-inducing protein